MKYSKATKKKTHKWRSQKDGLKLKNIRDCPIFPGQSIIVLLLCQGSSLQQSHFTVVSLWLIKYHDASQRFTREFVRYENSWLYSGKKKHLKHWSKLQKTNSFSLELNAKSLIIPASTNCFDPTNSTVRRLTMYVFKNYERNIKHKQELYHCL